MAGGARTQILIAAVLFGTTGTAQAVGPELDPLAVGASRIAVGGALLGLVALVAAATGRLRAGTGGSPLAVLLAGACVAVYQATFFVAVADTGVAVGTVVAIGSGPAFAGLFARTFAGERLMLPLLAMVPAGGLARPGGLTLVLYLGAIPTALAYVLFARGLERTGASETATLTLAEPLTAAALGVIALGERPGLAAAAGGALVMGGLAVLALRPARGEAAAPIGGGA